MHQILAFGEGIDILNVCVCVKRLFHDLSV